jgi:WD40 repeat protein
MEVEVMSKRALVSVVCAVVLVAACGRASGGPITSSAYKVYEAVSDRNQIAVIDSQSHAIERWMPLGVPSSDWKHLYAVTGPTLSEVDPATGALIHSMKLPGAYQLPRVTLSGMPGGLSQNGTWIVVASLDQAPNESTSQSHFLVMNTSFNSVLKRIDLQGHFEFDAISNDGGRLYLIEYGSGGSYYVRLYEIGLQQLNPQVVIDKTNPSESMSGLKLSGIPSQDGGILYSIYARPTDTPFIHALDLSGPYASCIDLPGKGYGADYNALHWSLAMSGDGSHLYAANAAAGLVSDVVIRGNASPAVSRSVKIDSGRSVASSFARAVQAKELGANTAVVSPDGKTLVTAGSLGIVFIDTQGLRVTAHALTDQAVWSLALSPDGKVLFVLSENGTFTEVSMDTRRVGATFNPSAGLPLELMRVVAA